MKKMFLLVALIFTLTLSASAITVTYSSSGVFANCAGFTGCNTSQVQFGGALISFVGLTNSSVGFTGSTNSSLGDVILSCIGGGTGCGLSTLPSGMTLAIQITQSLPAGGSPGTLPTGTVTGKVAGMASNASISWTLPAVTLIGSTPGPIEYSVANSPLSLVPPSNDNCFSNCTSNGIAGPGGDTTVQGVIRDASVPEPATYTLVGGAMLAFGFIRRRRA